MTRRSIAHLLSCASANPNISQLLIIPASVSVNYLHMNCPKHYCPWRGRYPRSASSQLIKWSIFYDHVFHVRTLCKIVCLFAVRPVGRWVEILDLIFPLKKKNDRPTCTLLCSIFLFCFVWKREGVIESIALKLRFLTFFFLLYIHICLPKDNVVERVSLVRIFTVIDDSRVYLVWIFNKGVLF